MGINPIGYRDWNPSRRLGAMRCGVIAATGVRRTGKSKWLQRILFVALLPPIFFSVPFFVLEQGLRTQDSQLPLFLFKDARGIEGKHFNTIRHLDEATPEQVASLRYDAWSYLLLTMFRYPQAVLMVLMIGIAAPPLISHDIRSRAFLIYFSRPIGRWEYLLGKLGTLAFFLAMITTLPALLLYATGVILSPNLSVIGDTWDLPLRIVAASIVLILPTASLALMFSSLTTESRYASFAWFAFWIVGHVAYGVLLFFSNQSVRSAHPFSDETPRQMLLGGWSTLVSPYHVLGAVQSWIFQLETEPELVVPATALLAAATCVSLPIVYYRVSLPLRA